jgi:diguanylate cyclase (GGDEF)-like protein/PAS domain S-box-containing protein
MTIRNNFGSISHRVLASSVLGIVYFIAASASVTHTRFEGGTAFIWVASAVLLGGLLATQRKYWVERTLVCAIASFLATWLFSLGFVAGLLLATINVAEVLVATALLRRFKPEYGGLHSLNEVMWVLGVAGIVGPIVTSVPGALVISVTSASPFGPNLVAWVFGHALGMLVFGPVSLLLVSGHAAAMFRDLTAKRRLEYCLFIMLVAGVSAVSMSQSALPLLFLPFPFMVLASFQFERIGAVGSLLTLFASVTWFSINGHGPISTLDLAPIQKAMFLQIYLACASLTLLPLAADLQGKKARFLETRLKSALYRMIVDGTSDLIIEADLRGKVRFASSASYNLLGIPSSQLRGRHVEEFIHGEDQVFVRRAHQELLRNNDATITCEFRIVVANQVVGWFESRTRATSGELDELSGTVAVIRDVTDQKNRERALLATANTDPLTQLANRRGLENELQSRAKKHSTLALFDIDHFKAINDTCGHEAGDLVLQKFADLLRTELRVQDFACRYGGEEFAILVDGDLDAARAVCERIRTKFAGIKFKPAKDCQITASVSGGIAAMPPQGSVQQVFKLCDEALYRAKSSGRNNIKLAHTT